MRHVMIDLETLSTEKNAAIISIGATCFDPYSTGVEDSFHTGITLASYTNMIGQQFGFDISPSTLEWWLDRDRDMPRHRWLDLQKVDLATALAAFKMWFDACGEVEPIEGVWGNAASFDLTILSHAYKVFGVGQPWHFRAERCYRTLNALLGHKTPNPPATLAHDALADALWQTMKLQYMMQPAQ